MDTSRLIANLIDRSYGPPFDLVRAGAAIVSYPVAERLEGRAVQPKIAELRGWRRQSPDRRRAASRMRLSEMLRFAGAQVPYYRDLFAQLGFAPDKVADEPSRLADLPLLTKDIISEQGERLLSRPLAEVRHHAMTTGGSTGRKATIYYDQPAADYSSSVTTMARELIGASRRRSTLHLAAALPDTPTERWPSREALKCMAMNRSNVFFGAIDDGALEAIWNVIRLRRPYLVHGHPSTLHALADFVVRNGLRGDRSAPTFAVFESSGEVLDPRQQRNIVQAFGCRVVNRYGLAEFGVIAYQFDATSDSLDVLDSEAWIEASGATGRPERLIVTGLRNRLMPLVRYDSGDLAETGGAEKAEKIDRIVGRIHDVVSINGVPHFTHYVQDVLDHRIKGIVDFQIDTRSSPPVLRVAPDAGQSTEALRHAIEQYWPGAFFVEFVSLGDMLRVGDRAKFRHVVTA